MRLLYLASIVFLPWWISLKLNKSLESWWWNTGHLFLNDIQEKSIIKKVLVDEMLKEYPETHLQKKASYRNLQRKDPIDQDAQ